MVRSSALPALNTRTPSRSKIEPRQTALAARETAGRSLFQRVFRRAQPTTFQRCLAVHIHFAAPHREL